MKNTNRMCLIKKSVIALFLALLTLTSIQQVNAKQASDTTNEAGKVQVESKKEISNLPTVTYSKKGKNGSVVYINNKQAVWFVAADGNFTSEKRASSLVSSLKQMLASGQNAKTIRPVKMGTNTVVKAGNIYLFTADATNAKRYGVSTHELAFKWANDIRVALGAPRLVKDYSSVVSRGGYSIDFQRKYLGVTMNGLASWYGDQFHGRTSSDGSRFNMNEFTAAHKTLPFGTLVRVTNLRNNKSCVVKITDRGPYVGGRVIDLSKGAAKQIGMLSSGVSRVEVEVLGKY